MASWSAPAGSTDLSLYYVARMLPEASSTAQTIDGRKLSTLYLKDVPADLIPSRQSSRSAVEAVADLALIALSAELLGVMGKAQEITFDICVSASNLASNRQLPGAAASGGQYLYPDRDDAVAALSGRCQQRPYRVDPALAVAVKAKASEDASSSSKPASSFMARSASLTSTTSASISSGPCCCHRCSATLLRNGADMSRSPA